MTQPSNPVSSWSDYYKATLNKPLHPLYSVLEPYLPSTGKAVELGCGVGHGVLWFLEKGFEVTAVDLSPEAVALVASRVPVEHRERLELAVYDMRAFPSSNQKYDVVVAGFSLFFLSREDADRLWRRMRESIVPGGILMAQFMGPNDDWADRMATHTRTEVEGLLAGMKVLHLQEDDRDGQTSQGSAKHWHVFHVIASAR